MPEEHVEEVMQFILRAMARASVQPWDLESISQLSEGVRRSSAARSSRTCHGPPSAEKDLAELDVATMCSFGVRETIAIMRSSTSRLARRIAQT